MSDTPKKRKSPVKTIIQREEWHFKYEAARLIRDLYLQKKRPVPRSVHDHYTTLEDLFKKHKDAAKETTNIRLGKRWVKELLDSSAEFGQNTTLIQKVRAEATRRAYDRNKHQQVAQRLFHTFPKQRAYVAEQMRNWSFNDPYLAATNREQAEEICPAYHPQFAQHERNVRNTIFRAFEAVQYAISRIQDERKQEQERPVQVAEKPKPQVQQGPETIRPDLHNLEPKYKLHKEDMPPTWGKRPSETRLPEVLRNRCDDDFNDETEETTQPTPVAHHKGNYTQGLFPFMQHTKS